MSKAKDYIDNNITERRFFSDLSIEERAEGKGISRKITGYAAVFNKDSRTMESRQIGKFIERITPGAFQDALQDDVVALFNHDPNYPLARNGVNLKIEEDEIGLRYSFEAPETSIGNDLLANIRSGVITQSSFAFTIEKESWEERKGEEPSIRTIEKIKRLYDVSPVTYPAYPDTTVAARSFEQVKQNKQTEDQTKPSMVAYAEAVERYLNHIEK